MMVAPRSTWQTAVVVAFALLGILGACGHSSPKLPSDSSSGSIHQLITGPDGDQFLHDISTYKWGADSRRVTDLFTWIPREATSTDVREKTSAGETAHAIASFLADNSHDLMGGEKGSQASIGAVNPELTQTYADVVIPYLSAMVGDDAGTAGFRPLDGLQGPMPRTAAVFGVLATDSTAGSRLADAVGTVADKYEEGFVGLAAADPTSSTNGDLVRAARLLGLASSTGLRRSDGATFQPGDVVADLQFRIAVRMARGPNVDLPQQFFKSDGSLMSPQEVRAKSGEFGWEDYTSKLGAYLAKFPALTKAVTDFQREFSTAAESASK
jgi:hypothetical protein